MASNLTQIAIKTRQIIRYGIYFFILTIISLICWRIFKYQIYPALFPPPPPAATVGFGLLPQISFPTPTEPLPELSYTVETPSGGLPTLPLTMRVYSMPQAAATLSSADITRQKAKALGFDVAPVEVSETIYNFIHPTAPAVLEINIVTGAFSTSYNLAADPSPLSYPPPTNQAALAVATSALKKAGALPSDLNTPGDPDFLTLEGQNLVRAPSLSEAELIRVNLFRDALGKEDNPSTEEDKAGIYPNLTASPDQANVWFIISGAREDEKKIIASEFHHYAIDPERFETYPIKTAQQALEDLQSGKGYIANLGLNKEGKITLRDIYLAYYDPSEPSQFYQPIIVFEGDQDFIAYVPAILDEHYESATPAPKVEEGT